MNMKLVYLLLLLFASASLLYAQDIRVQEPSQEIMQAPRLTIPSADATLDPSAFPRLVSPQDIALATGNFLFHFTSARFQIAETGPEFVDFILEGYIANYSNAKQEFFDGDFLLRFDGQELLPNGNIMNGLKRDYGASRDYPGRNVPLVSRLAVEARSVKFIYLAYRIPAETNRVELQLTYQSGHHSTMQLLLIPADNDGTSDVTIYKLQVDDMVQYRFVDQVEGPETENGIASNIIDPFRYDNCSREPATISYDSYTSSEYQRLQNFELNISPETDTMRFITLFGLFVYSENVEERLFQLNYQRLESSREMISQTIQATTTLRAFTAFNYRVMEQPMRRVDTFRIAYGTDILELPFTIEYSRVQIDSFQEDITTEYCASRSQ